METLLADIKYALRRLAKQPAFAAIVILTLALGIGANTAIFSVVNAVLLRPLPLANPEQLVTVFHFYPNLNNLEAPVSAPGYRDYRTRPSFASAAVQMQWAPTLTGDANPERLTGSRVSADWFTTMGVLPFAGRPLRPDEDEVGKNRVVVLSYGLWQRLFGGDASVTRGGKTMSLNGEPYEIVGIMPATFRDFWNRQAELWTPLALPPENFTDNRRTNEFLAFTARLKPGVTVDAMKKEMSAYAEQLKTDFPNNYGRQWTLLGRSLNEQATGRIDFQLYVLLGAVAFVLLIACANVANLMLVRAASTHKESVIRTALGASRAQLIRLLLTESVVLAMIGAALGLALAMVGVRAIVALSPNSLPRSDEIGVDPMVLLFTFGIAVIAALVFGLVPALHSSRTNLHETLKEGGRGSSAARRSQGVREALVVTQMALALVLLVGAGLLLKSFGRLTNVDPGFNPDRLLTFNLALPRTKYRTDTSYRAFYDEALTRIGGVAGVQAVGLTSDLPFSGGWSTGSFAVEGYQPPPNQPGPWGDVRVVSAGFFETMKARVIRGRTFDSRDTPSSVRVAIVDDEMVRRYWPKTDPIGKRISRNTADPNAWVEVIGVVAHSKQESLDAEARVQLYFPYNQLSFPNVSVAIRTAGSPTTMVPAVRQAVQSIDRDMPLSRIRTMEEMVASSVGQRKLLMVLLASFSTLALVLASIGIYGVMSYAVAQRSHELGIRMALGAARGSVLKLVLRQGVTLAALGVLIGVFASRWLTGLLSTQLYDVAPRDVTTFAIVPLTLAAVALVATLVPALRATRVDPVKSLRSE
ncbi:MAG TPA: ABC transporter permease [Gemmatimonadaceae bacterium]|nr:ABC transporter permease [Gemmatimonadaceae bacterium]